MKLIETLPTLLDMLVVMSVGQHFTLVATHLVRVVYIVVELFGTKIMYGVTQWQVLMMG